MCDRLKFVNSGIKIVTFYKIENKFALTAEISLASDFARIGRVAPDEERIVLLKPVEQFSFTYGVSKGFLYICLYFKHQFIYCDKKLILIMNIHSVLLKIFISIAHDEFTFTTSFSYVRQISRQILVAVYRNKLY